MIASQARSGGQDNPLPLSHANRPMFDILLVEDSRADVHLVRTVLRSIGSGEVYNITDVPRLTEALKLSKDKSFDAAILDLNLLDSNGMESLIWLNAALTEETPIIVYSGVISKNMREEALTCGARFCVSKEHADIFKLRSTVRTILNRAPSGGPSSGQG